MTDVRSGIDPDFGLLDGSDLYFLPRRGSRAPSAVLPLSLADGIGRNMSRTVIEGSDNYVCSTLFLSYMAGLCRSQGQRRRLKFNGIIINNLKVPR